MTRDDPTAYVPPPAFGPFRVLHQVGVGALGPVFRTYEPTRDRLVAVKVFRLDIVPEQAQALADALSRASEAGLFHPSIVEPIASGVEGSVAYRAEEYVAAESLDVAMRHYAPAPLEKALPFVTQLAGAIDFARAAGIGHGGLHPRDIFITPDDARATGFGVVEALEQAGIRAPVRRPYSAPERIEGQPWGVAADIFSLAAITFELLTGRRPAGLGREAGALPEMPNRDAVHAVLARAMDQDPARRHATALGFAAALEAAWRGESEGASAPAAIPPGEFAVEERLDPLAVALDDATARLHQSETPSIDDSHEPTLFDRAEPHPSSYEPTLPLTIAREKEADIVQSAALTRDDFAGDEDDEDAATLALNRHGRGERFADEFVDEQHSESAPERDVAAVGVAVPGESGFEAGDRGVAVGPVDEEPADRSLASYIIVAAIGLILGFGAAYFMWGRNTTLPAAASATAANAAPSPTTETAASPVPESSSGVRAGSPNPPARQPQPSSAAGTVPERAAARSTAAPPASRENSAAASRASAPPAATRGEITVRSTPSRAGVTVNGRWRGRTPLTLDSLPFGNYIVRVVQPDYRTAREEFSLNAQNPSRTLNVRLESDTATAPPRSRAADVEPARGAATFTGTLFVDSHPQGATVVIDGKPVGKTPFRMNDVRIGTHVVRLELARHRPWFSTARVVAGQEVRVAGSLEEIQ